MKQFALLPSLLLLLSSCDDNTLKENSPCEGQTCDGHGICRVDQNGEAYCECEEFYTTDGDNKLTCIVEGMNNDKPVIYLYPKNETRVTVAFDHPESVELLHTYPEYEEDGWCVTALPDGTLFDCATGQEFYALYWEGSTPDVFDLSTGFVVEGSKTIAFLEEKLSELGLRRREANEFIVYWLPILEKNPYNFIHFAQESWVRSASLVVTPQPDTQVRFLMLHAPLKASIAVPPQRLVSPERKGFVLVEWGGRRIAADLNNSK